MNNYQMFKKIQEQAKVYEEYNNFDREDLIDELVEEKRINENNLEEIDRLNNIIDELEKILNLMIYQGYYDIPKADYEGTAVQGFMPTGENSEFGIRAKFILDKLNELKVDNK